jgi:hypothetical protein
MNKQFDHLFTIKRNPIKMRGPDLATSHLKCQSNLQLITKVSCEQDTDVKNEKKHRSQKPRYCRKKKTTRSPARVKHAPHPDLPCYRRTPLQLETPPKPGWKSGAWLSTRGPPSACEDYAPRVEAQHRWWLRWWLQK